MFGPLWGGRLGTAHAGVGQALQVTRQQIAELTAGRIDQAQLDDAKTYLTGSFPLRLTSNDSIAGTLVTMQVDQLGIDYLDKRNGYIEAVTLADVRRVAARLYQPENLLVVVVGEPEGLEG